MTEKELRKKEALIKRANDAYYIDNESIMSDEDYDKIVAEIQKYYQDNNIENNGPTAKVGSSLSNGFNKVEHKIPMLSLGNTYNIDELYDFLDKLGRPDVVLESKVDGLSCHLKYEKGVLVQAVTRGDGMIGEDVTENVLASPNIPNKIKQAIDIEIRGEVYIDKDSFEEINKKQTIKYATARNLASGSLRLKDSSQVKDRCLSFVGYYILNPEKYGLKTQVDVLEYIFSLGISYPVHIVVKHSKITKEHMQGVLGHFKTHALMPTDGMVCKINDLSKWSELGNTSKIPRWAIAYKFPTEEATSALLSVEWQVGRTGRVTPVANISPVTITGTVVSRATLNNPEYIRKMNLMINDIVVVKKAAEIIPQIVYPVFSERDGEVYPISIPEFCPVCGSNLLIDGPNIVCPNQKCPAIIKGNIIHFVSKQGMDINGFGESVVEELYDKGFIKDIPDIYDLHKHYLKLIDMENWGEKSVQQLLKGIDDSKKQPFEKVLVALGIPSLGKTNAKRILAVYNNWDKLELHTIYDFAQIKGIATTTATLIKKGIMDKSHIMTKLIKHGLKSSCDDIVKEDRIKYSITGAFDEFTRDELTKYLEEFHDGEVVSVSKQTDVLIVGKKYSESKVSKVRDDCYKLFITDEKEDLESLGRKLSDIISDLKR